MGTLPDTTPFRIYNGIPGKDMIFLSSILSTTSAEVREALMGFQIGDTAAPGLSAL